MRNLFIITGASRGIGRELAEELSSRFGRDENTFVLIARDREKLESVARELKGKVVVLPSDLAKIEEACLVLENTLSELKSKFDKAVLVNNAGVIEPIGFLGTLDTEKIVNLLNVNLTSAIAFTNSFLKILGDSAEEKLVLNISSGAAKYPIVCWSCYCSSKAGMDMFTRVAAEEGRARFFTIAPGIVETDMQKVIRSKDKSDFPLIDDFVEYQRSGIVKNAEQSAREIADVIEFPDRFKTVIAF